MMALAWTYLFWAGLFEIEWLVGLKMAQTPGKPITDRIRDEVTQHSLPAEMR